MGAKLGPSSCSHDWARVVLAHVKDTCKYTLLYYLALRDQSSGVRELSDQLRRTTQMPNRRPLLCGRVAAYFVHKCKKSNTSQKKPKYGCQTLHGVGTALARSTVLVQVESSALKAQPALWAAVVGRAVRC